MTFLQCLAFSSLLGGSQAGGSINCGNHAGPSCHNNWNDIHCGTGENCCTDDFNGWCCPVGFKCNGDFRDPGGNDHCMTISKHSSSCLCDQTDYEIIVMDPVGEATVDASWNSDLTACCESPTEECGWSTTITKSNSQTVSWSDTAEVGFHMTWNVLAGPAIQLGEIGFEVQDTFTYGQTTTTETKQSYTNECICTASDCQGPWTNVIYKMRVVSSSQPVSITARKCGVNQTLPGTVKTEQWMGESQCVIQQGLEQCPTAATTSALGSMLTSRAGQCCARTLLMLSLVAMLHLLLK